jgi:adenosine deaminase
MKEKGISFSFSSDDPAVFHTSLAWQYRVALAKMGMSRQDVFVSIMSAIDAAFCSDKEKNRLREALKDYAVAKKLGFDFVEGHIVGNNSRVPLRRAKSESFADRVYVSKSQYF